MGLAGHGSKGPVGVRPRATETAWHSLAVDEGYRPEGQRRGALLLIDDVELAGVADGSYDAVISSHVLEHLANPLLALAAWRRGTRPGGHVLLIAPHKEGTFDHRRPTTTLAHLVDDRERNTSEDDLTHLDAANQGRGRGPAR